MSDIVLLIPFLSPLLLSCHLPFFLPSLGAFPSAHPFYDSDRLLNINGDRNVFSTLGENFAVDPLGLGIAMQNNEENRFFKFRRSFFKTMFWLTRHFSYCYPICRAEAEHLLPFFGLTVINGFLYEA